MKKRATKRGKAVESGKTSRVELTGRQRSEIDGWKKNELKRRREEREERRSVTPEHIKYFMRRVVQQRQARGK